MNNALATTIRNFGIDRVFSGIDFSELIQIDSGKFIFPVDMDDITYFCEVDFIAKKEDYTPDYDIRKYAEKVEKAKIREKEKADKKAEKQNKSKKPVSAE